MPTIRKQKQKTKHPTTLYIAVNALSPRPAVTLVRSSAAPEIVGILGLYATRFARMSLIKKKGRRKEEKNTRRNLNAAPIRANVLMLATRAIYRRMGLCLHSQWAVIKSEWDPDGDPVCANNVYFFFTNGSFVSIRPWFRVLVVRDASSASVPLYNKL